MPPAHPRHTWTDRILNYLTMAFVYLAAVYDDICWYWDYSKDFGDGVKHPLAYMKKHYRRWDHRPELDRFRSSREFFDLGHDL